MTSSLVQEAYSAYYQAYQQTKRMDESVPPEFQKGYTGAMHGMAEKAYHRFKKLGREWSEAHPAQAEKVDQILSNTQIMRHRQKEAERKFHSGFVPGKTFPKLAGQPNGIQARQRVLLKKLKESFEMINKCEADWEGQLRKMDAEHQKSVLLRLQNLETSLRKLGTYDRRSITQVTTSLDDDYKQSKPRKLLVQTIENLKAFKVLAEKEHGKLKRDFIAARVSCMQEQGTDEEPQSLQKLERMSTKIARFSMGSRCTLEIEFKPKPN